jgi:UDP-3-O-acyl-N-acetylglucosamine deacetylase
MGLHTGEEVDVELRPAEPGAGVIFVRMDLPGEPVVEACLENLVARPRRTALAKGKAEVHTVEHLLSALYGAGVQNLEIRINGPELPGLDGSALPYYEAIKGAGVREQGKRAREVHLRQPLAVTDRGASIVALSRPEGLRIGFTLDYSSLGAMGPASLGTQFLELDITEERDRPGADIRPGTGGDPAPGGRPRQGSDHAKHAGHRSGRRHRQRAALQG